MSTLLCLPVGMSQSLQEKLLPAFIVSSKSTMLSIKLFANDCQEVALPKNKGRCLFSCLIPSIANAIPSCNTEETDRKSICISVCWLSYRFVNLSIHLSYKLAYLCILYTHCISLLIKWMIDLCQQAVYLERNISTKFSLSFIPLLPLSYKHTHSH